MKGRRIIAIDFDGTLTTVTTPHGEKSAVSTLQREANPHVVKYARWAYDQGDFIVVYTARPWEDRAVIKAWLVANSVPHDLVECGKLRFDLLIDDKAMHPRGLEKPSIATGES